MVNSWFNKNIFISRDVVYQKIIQCINDNYYKQNLEPILGEKNIKPTELMGGGNKKSKSKPTRKSKSKSKPKSKKKIIKSKRPRTGLLKNKKNKK